MTEHEFQWTTHDGLSMFARHWEPDGGFNGTLIVVIHGFSAHSGRYAAFAARLLESGCAVAAPDHRGHGRSGGKRGHTPSFQSLVDDVTAFVELMRERTEPRQLIVLGHSMGGNAVANYAVRSPSADIQGVVLSAPWLKLVFEPPAWKLSLARILRSLAPSITLRTGMSPDIMTRDKNALAMLRADPFNHQRMSSALFLGAVEYSQFALEHAAELSRPALILHGTGDRVTSYHASRQFAQSAAQATLKLYDGLYHELHHEPECSLIAADIVRFIDSL